MQNMSGAVAIPYPRSFAAHLRWANDKYPQVLFVQPLLAGAAVVAKAAKDPQAWHDLRRAEPSDRQLQTIGKIMTLRHLNRGINIRYSHTDLSDINYKEGGRGYHRVGNDFYIGLFLNARSPVVSSVFGYARTITGGRLGKREAARQLFANPQLRPQLVGMVSLWEATSKTLRTSPAIDLGQALDVQLTRLNPADDQYQTDLHAAIQATERPLKALVGAAVAAAFEAQPDLTLKPALGQVAQDIYRLLD